MSKVQISLRLDEDKFARVGIYYRTLAIEIEDGFLWFWIGNDSDYDKIIS